MNAKSRNAFSLGDMKEMGRNFLGGVSAILHLS